MKEQEPRPRMSASDNFFFSLFLFASIPKASGLDFLDSPQNG